MSKLLRLNEKVIIKPSYIQSVCVCHVLGRVSSECGIWSWALVITLPDNNRIQIGDKDEETCHDMFEKLWGILSGEKILTSDERKKGLFWKESEEEIEEKIKKEKKEKEREEKERAFLKWDRFVFGEMQDDRVKKMELSDFAAMVCRMVNDTTAMILKSENPEMSDHNK